MDLANFSRLFPELEKKFWHPGKHIKDVYSYLLGFEKRGYSGEKFMSSAGNKNDKITAGYTYLGQFIAHDVSFSQKLLFNNLPKESVNENLRSPSLDLDSIYGSGPFSSPVFYDQKKNLGLTHFVFDTRSRFIGDSMKLIFDLPRKSNGNFINVALIPDTRNDENVILSQMHLAFQLFHNKITNKLLLELERTIEKLVELNKYIFGKVMIKEELRYLTRHENPSYKLTMSGLYESISGFISKYQELSTIMETFEVYKLNLEKKLFKFIEKYPWQKFENYNYNDLERIYEYLLLSGEEYAKKNEELSRAAKLFLETKKKVEIKLKKLNESIRNFDVGFYLSIFREARRLTTWHYQWIIIHDYLPKIIGKDLLRKLIEEKKQAEKEASKLKDNQTSNKRLSSIPIEFSFAAFRFGHSMVRDSYKIKKESTNPSKLLSIKKTNQRFNDILDWRLFFSEKKGTAKNINFSMRIDPRIAENIMDDLNVNHSNLGIVARNLIRSWQFKLPSGQKIADHLNLISINKDILQKNLFLKLIQEYKSLNEEQLSKYETEVYRGKSNLLLNLQDSFPYSKKDFESFLDNSPLWFYILMEAYILEDGVHLGPVGGHIVAKVLLDIIEGDKNSFLCQQPDWKPNFFDDDEVETPGDFTMVDLLKIAGVWEGAYVKEKDDCDKSNT